LVLATIMVIESASDSKLWIDVGVNASCCTFKFIDARGLRFEGSSSFLIKSSWPLLLSPSARENVWRNGDFSGAVFDRCSAFERGTDVERGDAARLLLVLGKSDSRGDGEGTVGEVALR
jgi:hypothetical protein